MPTSARAGRFVAPIFGLSLIAVGCASDSGLPSDRPFEISRYNSGPNTTTTGGKTSAADLVATPPLGAPTASPTAAPSGASPFQFNVNCIDDATGQTFKSGDPGYDGCLAKKRNQAPTPR